MREQKASLTTARGSEILVDLGGAPVHTEVWLQAFLPGMDGPGRDRIAVVKMTAAEARVISERLEQAARRLEREQANKSVGTSDR